MKLRMKKMLSLLFLAACCLMAKAQDPDAEYAREMFQIGDRLPRVEVPDLKGNVHSLKEFRGKYVVLDFWATWCPDCRQDVPAMVALHEKYASDKVVFVGISFDTKREQLEGYLAENGMNWLQLCDFRTKKESPVAEKYRIRWIPAIYLVDPKGKVVLSTVVVDKLAAELERVAR